MEFTQDQRNLLIDAFIDLITDKNIRESSIIQSLHLVIYESINLKRYDILQNLLDKKLI